mgnify:CR=1 FL=1
MPANILFLCTDQQRHDTLGASGNPHIWTPHLDHLCESGVRFSRAYTDAPVCAPARATMLTGRHWWNFPRGYGNFGQTSVPPHWETFPALLTRNGYQTRLVGKAHYHPERCHFGWEGMEILEDYYREMAKNGRETPMNHGLGQNEMAPALATTSANDSLTHWTTQRALNFLETRDPTRPFCLKVSYSKPHPPFDPPLEFWKLYENADVPEAILGDWSQNADEIAPALMQPTWSLNGADRFSSAQIRQIRRAYYALITQIDYSIGHILGRLRELDLLDDTLIVFTSDHGEMLGDHHMGAKTTFLEGAAHIPMILRPPANSPLKRGATCDEIVCLADLLPTFCAAAGLDASQIPANDGHDLAQLASGETGRKFLVGRCSNFHAVIEKRWKLIWNERGGAQLLFDLANDPHETRDQSQNPECAAPLRRLRAILAQTLEETHHPAAQNGELISTGEAQNRDEVRQNAWLGLHTISGTRHDVLH